MEFADAWRLIDRPRGCRRPPGQVQWDGQYLAIGDEGVSPSIVYQFSINGSALTNVSKTTLGGSVQVEQFWIRDHILIAPDYQRVCATSVRGCVAIYKYPAGGNATATMSRYEATGATISAP